MVLGGFYFFHLVLDFNSIFWVSFESESNCCGKILDQSTCDEDMKFISMQEV